MNKLIIIFREGTELTIYVILFAEQLFISKNNRPRQMVYYLVGLLFVNKKVVFRSVLNSNVDVKTVTIF